MVQEHNAIRQEPILHQKFGKVSCFIVFGLGVIYAAITTIGLLSLPSPQDPIADPWFTAMEILSILISLSMAISVTAIHQQAPDEKKMYSLTALGLMFIMTGITTSVHFTVLTVSRSASAQLLPDFSLFFSFRWPSVVYALDILAWDWFFGLSVLFVAPLFEKTGADRLIRSLLIASGILSLGGLMGVPLENMNIRNIGIVGYAVIGPLTFLLIGIRMGRAQLQSL